MAKSQKADKLSAARALYAEGVSKPAIAGSLHVSPRTIRRWAQQDTKAGRAWPREAQPIARRTPRSAPRPRARSEGASAADRLRRKLEERLELLIENSTAEVEDARVEERMLRICKVLDYLRGDSDDLGAQLSAMKRFASFCVGALPEREMTPVRKAIRLFVEDLKREHS